MADYTADQIAIADRNVQLYVFVKIFAKRVFLPLSAIYFIENAGFTIQSIGLLGTFFALTQLFAELPTGYFADKFGRVKSIRLAALLNIIATLLYVAFPNKGGVFVGQFLEAAGYCFLAGAGEAMIHDSLVVKRQTAEYTKILSRAQSVSLVINAVLIALIPMTYRLDPRAPFLIGTLAYSALLFFAFRMQDVKIPKVKREKVQKFSLQKLFRLRHLVGYGILFGMISALFTGTTDLSNIAFKEFGLKPELLGWLFAAGSLVGAIIGRYMHLLKKLKMVTYLLIDCLSAALPLLAIYSQSLPFMVVTFIFSISFWRYRRIIYQDHLLSRYSTDYKAVLISGMSYVEELNLLWLPIILAWIVSRTSLSDGFGIAFIFTLLLTPLFIVSTLRVLRHPPAIEN